MVQLPGQLIARIMYLSVLFKKIVYEIEVDVDNHEDALWKL